MSSGNPLDVALSALEAQAAGDNGRASPSGEVRVAQLEVECEACRSALEEQTTTLGRLCGRLSQQVDRLEGTVERLRADLDRHSADIGLYGRMVERQTQTLSQVLDVMRGRG